MSEFKLRLRVSNQNNYRVNTKPKTATASFRLDEAALEALHDDAKKHNVSVNTLLNQLLLTYSSYDRPMNRFQIVKLPAPTLNYVFQAASKDKIEEAGRLAGNDVPKTYILAKWGVLNVANCLLYLKAMSTYAKLFEYSEVVHDGVLSVTLSHNFGAKGTWFFQSYVKQVFLPSGKVPKFSQDENAVVFELY